MSYSDQTAFLTVNSYGFINIVKVVWKSIDAKRFNVFLLFLNQTRFNVFSLLTFFNFKLTLQTSPTNYSFIAVATNLYLVFLCPVDRWLFKKLFSN